MSKTVIIFEMCLGDSKTPSYFEVEIDGSIHVGFFELPDSAQIDTIELESSVETPSATLKLPGRIVCVEEITAERKVVLYAVEPSPD